MSRHLRVLVHPKPQQRDASDYLVEDSGELLALDVFRSFSKSVRF